MALVRASGAVLQRRRTGGGEEREMANNVKNAIKGLKIVFMLYINQGVLPGHKLEIEWVGVVWAKFVATSKAFLPK